jgi:phosphohistidine phosphatase SixA
LIRLYLIRHAAQCKVKGSRALTKRGRRSFRRAARAFAKLEEPLDLICSSSKPHARQTAKLLARALERDDVVELHELSPRVPPASLLRALAEHARDGSGIALIGHRRQLRGLLARLGLRDGELRLRKGSILRVDVDTVPRPRACVARFRLHDSASEPEDAFLGLRRAS